MITKSYRVGVEWVRNGIHVTFYHCITPAPPPPPHSSQTPPFFTLTQTCKSVKVENRTYLSKQSRTFPNVPSPNKLFISSENNKIKSYKLSSCLHVAKKLIAKTANQLRYELFYLNTNNAIQHNKIIIISSQIMKTVSSDSS